MRSGTKRRGSRNKTSGVVGHGTRTMVEQPKVENKNESTDKKPRRWRRNKYSTSTHDTSGKEKFEGAADEMKGNVFSIGKH